MCRPDSSDRLKRTKEVQSVRELSGICLEIDAKKSSTNLPLLVQSHPYTVTRPRMHTQPTHKGNTHTHAHWHSHTYTNTAAHASTRSNHSFLFFSSILLTSLPCSNSSCISKGQWGNPEVMKGDILLRAPKWPKAERWVSGGGAPSFLEKNTFPKVRSWFLFPGSGYCQMLSKCSSLTTEISVWATLLQRGRICPGNANQPTQRASNTWEHNVLFLLTLIEETTLLGEKFIGS